MRTLADRLHCARQRHAAAYPSREWRTLRWWRWLHRPMVRLPFPSWARVSLADLSGRPRSVKASRMFPTARTPRTCVFGGSSKRSKTVCYVDVGAADPYVDWHGNSQPGNTRTRRKTSGLIALARDQPARLRVTRVTRITCCRLCGSEDLVTVLDLGEQALTGVFPAPRTSRHAGRSSSSGAVLRAPQLAHCFEPTEMYGDNYGYRSGLNRSMVGTSSARRAGSKRWSDSRPATSCSTSAATTARSSVHTPRARSVASASIRPPRSSRLLPARMPRSSRTSSRARFREVASAGADRHVDRDVLRPRGPGRVRARCPGRLADDGVWHFEQCYMPSMLRSTATTRSATSTSSTTRSRPLAGSSTKPDLELSTCASTGSTAAASPSPRLTRGSRLEPQPRADRLVPRRRRSAWGSARPARSRFEERVFQHRTDLIELVRHSRGRRVGAGLRRLDQGQRPASVLRLRPDDIEAIAEVNEDKFGRVTPGSGSRSSPRPRARAAARLSARLAVALPRRDRRARGGLSARRRTLIFPLPEIEIVGA